MATRMLIDATQSEETRVVVVDGNRLTEFDFESSTRKPLKGNIYLAKITRAEPSLQAAFVDYGGNRDGFLSFNEIHPDYYQIPVADRQALLEQEAVEEEAAGGGADDEAGVAVAEAPPAAEGNGGEATVAEDDAVADAGHDAIEDVGGDELEEASKARRRAIRPYKIQEVIKRRQILLVQVVKEERGNKGAALTTYLSLAGRYCVLMPNTTRGGGISRKIVNAVDRKQLKDIVGSLDVPEGMGVIVRTAGMNRTKPEIKRDFDYLLRLWDDIREKTLTSRATTLVYEDANLIKRSIRDLYNKDIEEILVGGEDAYRAAKTFMRMFVPSRAKVVQPYRDRTPLFHRYKVEEQFDAMHSPIVRLKSGGYLVINQTEALVSIDVNSGRATKERNIEETALKTNLETAEELPRQLRLRDLSGLIVIDFIDMEVSKNNRAVERRLKEYLKSDRARSQVGRISPFGLLEMSRQRLRPSLLEASTEVCPQCAGRGLVRSTESSALHILRAIEEEGLRKQGEEISVHVAPKVALYLLNFKRAALATIEKRYGLAVFILDDQALAPGELRIERQQVSDAGARRRGARKTAEAKASEAAEEAAATRAEEKDEAEEAGRKRRRRPHRRKRVREEAEAVGAEELAAKPVAEPEGQEKAAAEVGSEEAGEEGTDTPRKRRRRGKRGGRRRSRAAQTRESAETADEGAPPEEVAKAEAHPAPEAVAAKQGQPDEKPKRRRRARRSPRTRKASESPPTQDRAADEAPAEESPLEATSERAREKPGEAAPSGAAPAEESAEGAPATAKENAAPPERSARRGWWRRTA